MGKNKSKRMPKTEFSKFKSVMAKLDYQLKKEAEIRAKEKKEKKEKAD